MMNIFSPLAQQTKSERQAPRANTQKNVNQTVYRIVREYSEQKKLADKNLQLLDLPCGEAEFSLFLKDEFNNWQFTGVDFFTNVQNPQLSFHKSKAHDFFNSSAAEKYDIVLCISGIMCFDGLEKLVHSFYTHMPENALLIMTNDNVLTIRDRLHFLFFGRFKRFSLLNKTFEGNWNLVLPQGLHMVLRRENFKDINYRYCSVYPEDFILLPLALLIYPLFFLYLITRKSELSLRQKLNLFPAQSMYCRHYVVTAYKRH